MRVKFLCRRRRCVWRNADGFCLMAHRCPTGDRCAAIAEQVGAYDCWIPVAADPRREGREQAQKETGRIS